MAGELEAVIRQMFDALEKKDAATIMQLSTDDTQGVDEISRHWMRGRDELGAYIGQLMAMVNEVHSELRDVRETMWGDTGIATFWLEQDYTLEGRRQHVSAPTSVVLRREDDGWRMVLFHSVPLP